MAFNNSCSSDVFFKKKKTCQILLSSICPYVFSCKMFVKSDFSVYSHLEDSSDEKKKDCIFF